MLKIQQFRYSVDNFAYLVYAEKSAGVIDGGAVEKILAFMTDRNLKLNFIVNTHMHADHTVGTEQLSAVTAARFIDNRALREQAEIHLEGQRINVHHTPGHTDDSLSFHFDNVLVTGDTLFNGTVGNCFSGDLKGFLDSIKFLMTFSGETIIYAGHDYVKDSMSFAKSLEPDNIAIDQFLKKYNPQHVYSLLQEELAVNPYLKFNDHRVIDILQQKGLAVDTEYSRWESLMSLE